MTMIRKDNDLFHQAMKDIFNYHYNFKTKKENE